MDAVTDVIQALRRYLQRHPQAGDTITGIAAWWPLPRPGGSRPEIVGAAVAALVASGEMECAVGPDGQAVYRAAARGAGGCQQGEPPGS